MLYALSLRDADCGARTPRPQADVGQTYNSSLTAQYITVYDNVVANSGGVDMIMNVADLTYADNYGPGTANLPNNAGISGTNQQRWDTMFTMWQPVLGGISAVHAAGNHEVRCVCCALACRPWR